VWSTFVYAGYLKTDCRLLRRAFGLKYKIDVLRLTAVSSQVVIMITEVDNVLEQSGSLLLDGKSKSIKRSKAIAARIVQS